MLDTYIDVTDGVGCWYDSDFAEHFANLGQVDVDLVVDFIIDEKEPMNISLASIGEPELVLEYEREYPEYDFDSHHGTGYALGISDSETGEVILTLCVERDDEWISDNAPHLMDERGSYEKCIGILVMALLRVGQWID